MSVRIASGIKWFKTVMIYVVLFVVAKAVLALGTADVGKGLAEALMLLLGSFVLIGIPAFIGGWLRGGR